MCYCPSSFCYNYIETHSHSLCHIHESWILKCIHLTNMLYSTGNSTQYSAMAYMGKKSKKEWIYVYV